MPRPSKLTDAKWEEIGKKLLSGESTSELARQYGVSKGAISQRFSKRNLEIKDVANQIVKTDLALSKLNVSEQIAAVSLADDLKAITGHVISAARYSAATSNRLAGMAHIKSAELDDSEGLSADAIERRKDVMMLQRMANEAASIPIDLLKANKDAVDNMNKPQDERPKTLNDFYS